MAQFARPDSDVQNTGFAGGWADVDETTGSDADYWSGNNNAANRLEAGLSNVTDPNSSTGHVLRYRVAKGDTDGTNPDGGGNAVTITAYVWQGTTQIAVDTAKTLDGTWTTYELALSGAEADTITDYTDLRIEFITSASGGSPAARRCGLVSWTELEVPDASGDKIGSDSGVGAETASLTVTRYISPSGNDTTGTGTEALPWATIAKAVSSSTAGDTVLMRGGTYAGGSQITKLLHFKAYPTETPIVSGGTQCWDVRVGGSGGSATGIGFTASTNHGAYVDGVSSLGYQFIDCNSYSNGHSGYHIIRSDNVLIDGGTSHDNTYAGIRDIGSAGGADENTGIVIDGVNIYDNGLTNPAGANGDGILVQGQGTIVRFCTITGNGTDTVLEHGIYLGAVARGYSIHDNVLADNSASAIKVDGGGEVYNNTGSGSRQGLALDGAPSPVVLADIHDNDLSGTLYAVLVTVAATVITNHSRWELDFNAYSGVETFSDKGTLYDFADWKTNSTQDANSTFSGAAVDALLLGGL